VAWTKISQAIPVIGSKRLTFFSKAWFKSFMQSQPPGSITRSPNTGQHSLNLLAGAIKDLGF
jgi:hypothetical protein